MEADVGDQEHHEEELRTSLHCDDKDKLRRKLAQLQKEYVKTAQRLQRAERLDAVRRHVRSRITQQNQRHPEVTSHPASLKPNSSKTPGPGLPEDQREDEDVSGTEPPRRTQTIRFLLPSDEGCPQSPDPSTVPQSRHEPSPALRSRSRLSLLRPDRRSSCGSPNVSQKEHEQNEGMGSPVVVQEKKEEIVKPDGSEVVNESEELFSGSECESPSLLLTHWNTHRGPETADFVGKKITRDKKSKLRADRKTESECCSPQINIEEEENKSPDNRRRKGAAGGEDGLNRTREEYLKLGEGNSNKDAEQNPGEIRRSDHKPSDTPPIKEGTHETEEKSPTLRDSCTLVDGLLFPVEYYVRTTRRMTSSQCQPDMQAVLSQLSAGRHRRSRGRGRGTGRSVTERSDGNNQTDFSSASTAHPLTASMEQSNHISGSLPSSQIDTDARFPSPAARRGRGRTRRRGRARRNPQGRRSTIMQVSTSQSVPVDEPQPSFAAGETPPVAGKGQPSTSQSTDSLTCSRVEETPSSSGPAQQAKVYPVFLQSATKTNRSSETNSDTSSLRSFPLPCSPQLPTSLSPGPLTYSLINSRVHQDFFHLPDDQFASLKLLKLRQVAVNSGVEDFSSPSHITRSTCRRSNSQSDSSNDPETLCSLPLSLTPSISNSPRKLAAASQNLSKEPHREAEIQSSVTETVEHSFETGNGHQSEAQSSRSAICTHADTPQLHLSSDSAAEKGIDQGHTNGLHIKEDASVTKGCSVVHPVENKNSGSPQEEGIVSLPSEAPCDLRHTTSRAHRPLPPVGESPVKHLEGKSPIRNSSRPSESNASLPADVPTEDESRGVPPPLFLTSPSARGLLTTPHLPSCTLSSSPALPSLGLTPHLLSASLPLTSSPSTPSAPSLSLPPPHSPSTQALSPPPLSPCPSIALLPPASSSSGHISFSTHRPGPGGWVEEEEEEEEKKQDGGRKTHTLKAAAGGFLMDACCFPGPSGSLCVVAAGQWAVCLWTQTSTSDWSLKHTWTFNEPVINVFPVPDAAGLVCVTLGQLEIRQVRLLWSCSLVQQLLCEGLLQAVVGVRDSRVVSSSPSATGSTLQVFSLSESCSVQNSHLLACPGVCVGALAPVDGLLDALIGSNDSGCIFMWNLKSGQLLRKVLLGDALVHTACLRGYSHSGVLFILLQHHFLSSLEGEEVEKVEVEDGIFREEMKNALFSLVAVNPLNGKHVLASRLYPPEGWCGRLCKADVCCSGVVGLSQSGCVCVWEPERRGAAGLLWAPESEGRLLARWGGADMLVTGHHNGDVTLHPYAPLGTHAAVTLKSDL